MAAVASQPDHIGLWTSVLFQHESSYENCKVLSHPRILIPSALLLNLSHVFSSWFRAAHEALSDFSCIVKLWECRISDSFLAKYPHSVWAVPASGLTHLLLSLLPQGTGPGSLAWLGLVLTLLVRCQGFWKIVVPSRQVKHQYMEKQNSSRVPKYLVTKAILKGKINVPILNSF